MIYNITLAVTFFLLGLLYGNLYGQYKAAKKESEKKQHPFQAGISWKHVIRGI